jgi:two-component system chemotaxis sensor kinase CheA
MELDASAFDEPGFNSFEMEFTLTITPEMMKTFTTEAEEQLEVTESSLLHMEQDFSDRESLDAAFRAMHTFKGNCGLFNFELMEKLGHEFESILESLKAGELVVEQRVISMLLQILDVLKHQIHDLQEEKESSIENFDNLMTMLTDFREKGQVLHTVDKGNSSLLGEILVERGLIKREDLDVALNRQAMPLGEILKEMHLVQPGALDSALQIQEQRRQTEASNEVKRSSSSQNIRVDLPKLDTLINLVGELIIAENMVVHNPDLENHTFENFRKATLHLNRISRELQDVAMSLRMVTIEGTFRKMTRVVRDVAQKQGKIVDLIMAGEDTEVDKNVAENIASPLLHLIRNAIDHGIEKPEVREANGKSRKGTIWLTATHEGGEVILEIRDNGAGIDTSKVLKKARENGLIDEHTEFESDQDIYPLIFEPGFSTAEQVTDISGRGVGMDVVKRSIENISGRISIESKPNHGTSFRISIPLTLAIIEGMLVRVDYQLFTIPLLSIRETIKVKPDQVSQTIDGSQMVKIRERLIPVMKLRNLFLAGDTERDAGDGTLVIVEMHGERVAMLVDEIRGQYQTVIKGMSSYLENVRGISGTSILSNGDISLILDIQSLVEWAVDAQNEDLASFGEESNL